MQDGKKHNAFTAKVTCYMSVFQDDFDAEDRETAVLANIRQRKRARLPSDEVTQDAKPQKAAAPGIRHLLPPDISLANAGAVEAALTAKVLGHYVSGGTFPVAVLMLCIIQLSPQSAM